MHVSAIPHRSGGRAPEHWNGSAYWRCKEHSQMKRAPTRHSPRAKGTLKGMSQATPECPLRRDQHKKSCGLRHCQNTLSDKNTPAQHKVRKLNTAFEWPLQRLQTPAKITGVAGSPALPMRSLVATASTISQISSATCRKIPAAT